MTTSNILLVGATGTVGYSLAKNLAKKNLSCRCLVRDKNSASHLSDLGMDLVVGDLTKPDTLPAALESIEKVFLCTGLDPAMTEMQINFANACAKASIKHLVKISMLGASPTSKMLFSKWHGQVEENIKNHKIPFTFLRPHYFMQNTLTFKSSIQSASAIFVPMNDARISLVDSDDVAYVACSVLTSSGHENKTYEVTGSQALSFSDIAAEFSRFYKKPVEFLSLPKEVSEASMQEAGAPAWLIEGTSQLYDFFNTGDAAFVRRTVLDVAQKSPVTFTEFLQKFSGYLLK